MNPYFSRLAQRSAVSPQTSIARPGGRSTAAETAWSEQSVEIAASDSTASGKHGDKEYGKEVHATAASKPDSTNETPQSSKAVSAPIDPAKQIQEPGNTPRPSGSRSASEIPSIDSGFQEHEQAIEQTAARVSVSSDPAPISATTSTSIKSVSAFSGQARPLPGAEEPETNAQPLHTSTFSAAVTEATSRSLANRNEKSVMATSGFENSVVGELNPTQVIRSNPVPPTQALKGERVMSGPVQAATLPVQQARPVSRSSIEVNIGKIELEVFAPAPKTAAPIAAATASAPRPKPAAIFNPHRHYLRGR